MKYSTEYYSAVAELNLFSLLSVNIWLNLGCYLSTSHYRYHFWNQSLSTYPKVCEKLTSLPPYALRFRGDFK